MPDGKTDVFTTDSPNFLIFERENLTTLGWLDWNETDFDTVTTGATHVVTDITTGDMLGCMTEMHAGIHTTYTVTFYRIKADNINKRIPIGKIELGSKLKYYHSFGHTDSVVVFPDNSIGFDVMGMFEGKPMEHNFVFDWDTMLTLHIMQLSDGTSKSFECDHSGYVIHSGNTFVKDNILTYEAEMYIKSEIDPFQIMDKEWLLNPDREAHHVGAMLRRYEINLDTEEIKFHNLVTRDVDTVGFAMYNPRFAGKENRYTYICALDYTESITRLL